MSIFGDGNKITYVADFPVASIIPRDSDTKIYTETARNAVRQSIKHFGVIEPLVLNEGNYLMHGALRLEVIQELGITSIPVVVLKDNSREEGVADLYHMLADRIVEWDKWDTDEATKVLADLVEDEISNGKTWREFFREIGWFTPDLSKKPTATEETLETIAHETTKWAATKHYHFDWAQVLYIEALRRKVQSVREGLIEKNETVGGVVEKYRRHMMEESNKMEAGEKIKPQAEVLADLKQKIKVTKKPTLGERAKIQLKGASQHVHKETTGGRMMGQSAFMNLATTFLDLTKADAEEKWDNLSTKEFNALCRKAIEANKHVDPPISKVHPLAVGTAK